jgi:tRNA (cmo5U34)-methyltransferase
MTHTASTVFEQHAANYNAARRRLIPSYDAFYGTATAAIAIAPGAGRILDLGAGTGLLSAHVRSRYPDAEMTLTDGSPAMLDQAREVLGVRGVRYQVADLTDPLPAGPWDAIVSALAIHHLDDPDKRRLFARICDELRPGGVFVNAEQVAGPTPALDEHYAAWHEREARAAGSDDAEWAGAVERMAHDRLATVEDQLRWLRDAGFVDADCLFKDHRFAVLFARRGAS